MTAFLNTRYLEAYKVCRGTVRLGRVIQYGSALMAAILLLASLVAWQYESSNGIFLLLMIPAALFIGVIGYCAGIIIAAQGQMAQAMLDSAVNTSPLATVQEKVELLQMV